MQLLKRARKLQPKKKKKKTNKYKKMRYKKPPPTFLVDEADVQRTDYNNDSDEDMFAK